MTPKQIETALAKIQEQYDTVMPEIAVLNEEVAELGAEIRAYIDERSEKWCESERGQVYDQFASYLENYEADIPELLDFEL